MADPTRSETQVSPETSTGPVVVILGSYAPSLINFRGPLIQSLVERGARVIAMAPAIDAVTAGRITALGAEPRTLDLVNSSLNPLKALKTIVELTGVFREIRPDALIAYTIKPVTLGALAAHRAGIGKITALITGLGFAFTGGLEPRRIISNIAGTTLYRLALARCGAVIFQNADDRDEFLRRGILGRRANITVVNGSGVDVARFALAPLPPSPGFLMISRLLKDKGVREYGAAAVALKARHPEIKFRLAGYFDPSPDSIGRAELDAMIAGGVEYLGHQDDVRIALGEASVYVLPSYREGTPRSVLEAMAMGRAIITTDAPGCRQTVADGRSGLLVPPRDGAALETAMESLILAPDRIAPMGAAARARAEAVYDVHQVNAEIIDAAGLGEIRAHA